MKYYVIGNKNVQKITTNAKEYESLLGKKTCHKVFTDKKQAEIYLGMFKKYYNREYNAFMDLEFTCSNKIRDFEYKNHQSEVLSIGIYITDNVGNYIDSFYSTVQPKYNKHLTSFCKELTHLTQEEIDKSEDLITVLNKVLKFLAKYKITEIYTYGTSDVPQIKKDILRYKNDININKYLKLTKKMKNIQREIGINLMGEKMEVSLENAKNICGIAGVVQHNALSDAKDLSKVLFCSFYNTPSSKKVEQIKEKRVKKRIYNSTRRIKEKKYNFTDEENEKIKEVCNIIKDKCDKDDFKTKCIIDDLLCMSNQEVLFDEYN